MAAKLGASEDDRAAVTDLDELTGRLGPPVAGSDAKGHDPAIV
jgi:hypothetical protein